MKKSIVILSLLCVSLFYSRAEVYKVIHGDVYYKENLSDNEVYVLTSFTIPSENVFVRMHEESNDNETFTLVDTKGNYFINCKAPKHWPGIRLSEVLKNPVKNCVTYKEVTSIAMGGDSLEAEHEQQFHYLCAVVKEYDDAHWKDFPYGENVIPSMENALASLRGKLQHYYSGKQYLLSGDKTTKDDIVYRLDSITNQATGKDLILLYLSSHGEYDADGQFELILKDSRYNSNGRIRNALSKTEINNYVNILTTKGASVLLFVDACNAGEIADNDQVKGWAAYYLSAETKSQAYTRTIGSAFSLALMDAMTGSFKKGAVYLEDEVTVGALGFYLSKSVDNAEDEQLPTFKRHEYPKKSILWVNASQNKPESIFIQRQKEIISEGSANLAPDDKAKAMMSIAEAYLFGKDKNGRETLLSIDSAYLWYDRARSMPKISQSTEALAWLGLYECFHRGMPEQNRQKAFECIQKAKELKNPKAMYLYGKSYIDGYYVVENFDEGRKWVFKAAKKGYDEAQRYWGFLNSQRAKLEKSTIRNSEEFSRVCRYGAILGTVSINYGHNGAQIFEYSNSTGYGKEAVKWYTKAALQGSARARHELGYIYYEGKIVDKNPKEAFKLIKSAAEQGYEYAEYMLGKFYFNGYTVKKDEKMAFEWMHKAAAKGHKSAIDFIKNHEEKN